MAFYDPPANIVGYAVPTRPDGESRTGQALDPGFFTGLANGVRDAGPRMSRLSVDTTGSVVPVDGQIGQYDATNAAVAVALGGQRERSLVAVCKTDSSSNPVTVTFGTRTVSLLTPGETHLFVSVSATAPGVWQPLGSWVDVSVLDTRYPRTQTMVYLSNDTWTKPPGAKAVRVDLIGGGGGGGGGGRFASGTASSGGAGGAGALPNGAVLPASALGATEPVTVGTGGPGGAAATADSTAGGAGTAGGLSRFGGSAGYVTAYGGPGGSGGNTVASVGGTQLAERATVPITNNGPNGGLGVAGTGGGNTMLPAPGGSGGGIAAASPASLAGGAGGNSLQAIGSPGAGGTPGGLLTGLPGSSAPAGYPGPGCGGGGGASRIVAGTGSAGFNFGSSGGSYGAGGGGAGACLNGLTAWKGGDGAPGIVVVTTYC